MARSTHTPTRTKRPINRTEEREQARLILWTHKKKVREILPELRWLYHCPNGGRRDGFTGAQMKALGVKPGYPDLTLPVRSGNKPGLVIEMKSSTGALSDEQLDWQEHFEQQGWLWLICRSADEARLALCLYLSLDPLCAPELDAE